MKQAPLIEVDLKGFKTLLHHLQKVTGSSFDDVLKSEAGMILSSATRTTPKASKKNIIRHNMPEGYKFERNIGEKLVIHHSGKVRHIGQPILAGNQPDQRGQKKPSGAGKHWKPKRGGKIYEKPYPNQSWMGRAKWNAFIEEQKIKTLGRIANRGMSAAQFGFMADLLNIKMVEKRTRPAYLQTDHLRARLKPFLSPRKLGKKGELQIVLESKGLKQTARTGAGNKLVNAAKGRVRLFRRAVKNDWIKDIKTFMPKNYPLLFNK